MDSKQKIQSHKYQIRKEKDCDKCNGIVVDGDYMLNLLQTLHKDLVRRNPDAKDYKQSLHISKDEQDNLNVKIVLEPKKQLQTV